MGRLHASQNRGIFLTIRSDLDSAFSPDDPFRCGDMASQLGEVFVPYRDGKWPIVFRTARSTRRG